MLHRRHCLAGLLAAPALARAEEPWPARSVRIILPYSPAGSSDAVGRFVAERLTTALGKPVIIENRAGLAGTIGVDLAAKSPPDGYTFVLITNNQTINETLQPRRPYVLMRDLIAVCGLNIFYLVLATTPALPVRTVPELIAYAKANPGRLDYASSGPGSIFHVAAEAFRAQAGIEMQHVPFRNYNEGRTALMSGDVQVMFDAIFTTAPLITDNRVRGLATTGPDRSPLLPALPVVAETLPGYEAALWNGLMAPLGTPAPVVTQMNAAVNRILADPAVIAAQARVGADLLPMSPAEFDAFIRRDIDRMRDWVHTAGITPE